MPEKYLNFNETNNCQKQANYYRIGRIEHVRITTDEKHHPILIPKNHTVTKLIANFLYVTYLHLGAQTLPTVMKQRYWPLNGRHLKEPCIHASFVSRQNQYFNNHQC